MKKARRVGLDRHLYKYVAADAYIPLVMYWSIVWWLYYNITKWTLFIVSTARILFVHLPVVPIIVNLHVSHRSNEFQIDFQADSFFLCKWAQRLFSNTKYNNKIIILTPNFYHVLICKFYWSYQVVWLWWRECTPYHENKDRYSAVREIICRHSPATNDYYDYFPLFCWDCESTSSFSLL